MRFRRLRRWWPAIPVVLIVLAVYAAIPGRWTFTVSPETTFVTEPVDAEGYPDFPTALNQRLSKGVTPENNANVLLMRALGPKPEGGDMPPGYFRWLGIDPPPEDGEYFVGRDKYFRTHLTDQGNGWNGPDELDDGRDPVVRWNERVDRAVKWPWKARDEPDIAAWLKQNEKPLALVIEAARRPQYFNPLLSRKTDPRSYRLISSLLPSVQKCREVGTALVCRAMRRIADGDFDGAWQDLLTCHRLGRLVGSRGTLIEGLVGIALDAIAANGEITLLHHAPKSSKLILAWLSDLQKLPPIGPFADKLDLSERFSTLDSLMAIALDGGRNLDQLSGDPGTAPKKDDPLDRLFTRSVDFDPAFRNANQMFDRWAAAARLPDRAARKQEFATILTEMEQMKTNVAEVGPASRLTMGKARRGELLGNVLMGLLLPAIDKVNDATDRCEQINRNLQVAFALAACRADNGRYPAQLNELAPRYLAEIPGDLFSGKPLVYRLTEDGYLLYSVGVNGKDDGGRWIDDDPKGDDPRVRMPVREPARK